MQRNQCLNVLITIIRRLFWNGLLIALVWCMGQQPVYAQEKSYVESTAIAAVDAVAPPQAAIEMVRLRSRVLPGVLIGGRYEGIFPTLKERYTATGQLDEEVEDAARSLIEDELVQAGLNVVRSPFNVLFDEQIPDNPEPGRFLLGGTITQTALRSYHSWWGDRTQDERTIRWEVFDREVGRVIYAHATQGTAQAEGVNNRSATYDAIRASVKALLADSGFITALASPLEASPVLPVDYKIAAIAGSPQPLTVEQLVGRSIPSVVQIRTPGGRGTGFLLDAAGLVITNQHVVDSAFTVKVDLYDGSTHTGRVLKRDRALDAALVKLEGNLATLTGLPICYSNSVKVGEAVVAIGNPMALANTVTQGVVSGFRTDSSRNLIQTDAAINPGNSGGPLLNRRGAVIGIVTEKMVSRGVEGLGFALPIGEALHRLDVKISAPLNGLVDPCGSPLTTLAATQLQQNALFQGER
ncbi:MAG: trypsin-like peptidase domain-containing protein [Leptolyngbyaceae cyanobacterium bins.349]|nr:trypsin-like peptidase domain-containing protein [Leptolyngbyaceae cyanobacterium bins.349]